MAQVKVKEFWQAPKWKENFIQSSEVMAELRKESIQSEMAQLSEVAPELEKTFFKNRSVEIQQKGLRASTVAIGEIEKAKSVVREKPFDKAAIENLFQMEKENKNLAMMQYLEGRLKNLQSSEVSK
jgi:Glu-tRNA(Gln) amidotransferase subunit E-like FAD-binding protein